MCNTNFNLKVRSQLPHYNILSCTQYCCGCEFSSMARLLANSDLAKYRKWHVGHAEIMHAAQCMHAVNSQTPPSKLIMHSKVWVPTPSKWLPPRLAIMLLRDQEYEPDLEVSQYRPWRLTNLTRNPTPDPSRTRQMRPNCPFFVGPWSDDRIAEK